MYNPFKRNKNEDNILDYTYELIIYEPYGYENVKNNTQFIGKITKLINDKLVVFRTKDKIRYDSLLIENKIILLTTIYEKKHFNSLLNSREITVGGNFYNYNEVDKFSDYESSEIHCIFEATLKKLSY